MASLVEIGLEVLVKKIFTYLQGIFRYFLNNISP